jgi:two-component system, OmpR family, sensor histidine kinase KdpD
MNIQHLESVSPTVENITGVKIRETVPDWVLQRVQEVVMTDLTPEALQTRMRRGDIYPRERTERALENFFKTKNIMALRELALRHVAQVVDRKLEPFLDKDQGLQSGVRERIGVCISSNPAAQHLVARGARMARGLDAELYVAYVEVPIDVTEDNQRTLNANIRFAQDLGAQIVRLPPGDVAERVAEFVRDKHITQVIFGHSASRGWRRYLYMSALHRFLRDAPPVDVHIVSQEAS